MMLKPVLFPSFYEQNAYVTAYVYSYYLKNIEHLLDQIISLSTVCNCRIIINLNANSCK